MQLGQRANHGIEIGWPFRARDFGECSIPEIATFHHFHDIEPAADHTLVEAQSIEVRDRKIGLTKCANHTRFPINRMRPFHQLSRRPAPQDIVTVRGDQFVSRVRLPPLELLHTERPRKIGHVPFHPTRERRHVESKAVTHPGRTAECFLIVHRFTILFPPPTRRYLHLCSLRQTWQLPASWKGCLRTIIWCNETSQDRERTRGCMIFPGVSA